MRRNNMVFLEERKRGRRFLKRFSSANEAMKEVKCPLSEISITRLWAKECDMLIIST